VVQGNCQKKKRGRVYGIGSKRTSPIPRPRRNRGEGRKGVSLVKKREERIVSPLRKEGVTHCGRPGKKGKRRKTARRRRKEGTFSAGT